MVRIALIFLTGILCLFGFSQVENQPWFCLLICCVLCLFLLYIDKSVNRRGRFRLAIWSLLILLSALCYAAWHAQTYMQHRYDDSQPQQDFLLSGIVSSLPEQAGPATRFEFTVDQQSIQNLRWSAPFPHRLRLSWYGVQQLNVGEHWQLLVRLKVPHGFMNPGGFDYEAWLFQNNIHATGYVRKSSDNVFKGVDHGFVSAVHKIRAHINHNIDLALPAGEFAGLIKALATGSRGDITHSQWQGFVVTGTSHLIAISGLHIGLAAMFGYGVALFSMKRFAPVYVLRRLPAQTGATLMAICMASMYALLAGLSIPTQRALLMLLCVSLGWLLRKHIRPLDSLALALILVLLLQPASVHAIGFWFSFIAVAVIMLAYQYGLARRPRWQQFVVLQCILVVALFPVSLFVFDQASLVAPLANLLMVPLVSFVLVPLILGGILLLPVSVSVFSYCMQAAHWMLEYTWPLMQWLSQNEFSMLVKHLPQPVVMIVTAAVLLLLFPALVTQYLSRIPPGKVRLAVLPLLLCSVPDYRQALSQGSVLLDVLDVGQGTAVVVRTAHHALVYDTGASFGSKLDAGTAVVVPALRHFGVNSLDKLVISHGDLDHIGGARSVLAAYPSSQLVGQQITALPHTDKTECLAGDSWEWDGVHFAFLHPDAADVYTKSNNRSCVLLIRSTAGTVLLTGDIERKVETRLLRQTGLPDVDVLLVPHHGSRTSSSKPFVEAVAPAYAVITAGYRNRYRLPAKNIVQRYQNDSTVLITGYSGAVRFYLDAEFGIAQPELYRHQHAGYWHHRPQYL